MMHTIPLKGPEPLSPWSGLEIYVASICNASPDETGDPLSDPEPFSGMAVLVNLSSDSSDRFELLPLRQALTFAECKVIGGTEWPKQFTEIVSLHQPSFVTTVIYVGSDVDTPIETVQSIIDTLKRSVGFEHIHPVIVSGKSESYAALVVLL